MRRLDDELISVEELSYLQDDVYWKTEEDKIGEMCKKMSSNEDKDLL